MNRPFVALVLRSPLSASDGATTHKTESHSESRLLLEHLFQYV